MTTFIVRLDDPGGPGLRLAVKDCFDVAGLLTTVGSPVLAELAAPAEADAACLAGARAAGARLVGKTNLHELCFGGSGVNPWFGTPVNPLDPTRIPGGSSSGSAVAVATGAADVAFGSDTAGSIRNPAAHCGVVGLKTTFGRVPVGGVWPLAPSMDTVGPLAADVAGVEAGMALLEPGFARATEPPGRIGRLRLPGVDPAIDAAVDAALAATGLEVVEVDLPGWATAAEATTTVLFGEALEVDGWIVDRHPDRVGADVRARLDAARRFVPGALDAARAHRRPWRAELMGVLATVEAIAVPSAMVFAPRLGEQPIAPNVAALPVNLAGTPAIAVPVPTPGSHLRASVSLLGADHAEERLVTMAALVEAAAPVQR